MNVIKTFVFAIFSLVLMPVWAQKLVTDANIVGHVVDKNGEHIPFANIIVKDTRTGTMTDETGHFELINLSVGEHVIVASFNGYKKAEANVVLKRNNTLEVNFELVEDVLGLDEVVVTGNKNRTSRRESTVIVNTIPAKLFTATQSTNLSEGLNFCTGLRTENNCQNCGFNQVRMNGLEGPYSQIVINGYPIFSGLAGVYGIELIPQNMIDKIEIVRGGGSALYGSNAIAGTINIILKKPYSNTYEIGYNSGFNGIGMKNSSIASDQSVNFNTSLTANRRDLGVAIYGFYRDRQPFDANGDSFSELARIKNLTLGNHLNYKINETSDLETDIFVIKEDRRGGNKFDQPSHIADISEALKHTLFTGAVKYNRHFDNGLLSLYLSGQSVDRDSYYGSKQSLSDYGKTKDFSNSTGLQYSVNFDNAQWTSGYERNYSKLKDKKLGYFDLENMTTDEEGNPVATVIPETVVSDQQVIKHGIFSQYERKFNKFKFSLGLRFENYNVEDNEGNTEKTGNVYSPKVTLKYDFSEHLQTRVSYGQGYRAPQIFDEDLHIETSGAAQIVHKNDHNLKQETSHSFIGSFDYNRIIGNSYFSLLVEGFYTALNDAFVHERSEPNEDGLVIATRTNAENGASVYGANIESNIIPSDKLSFKIGLTVQKSEYEDPQDFDETAFLRTPNTYGYLTGELKITPKFKMSSTTNYTGKMLVPYYGLEIADPDAGELRTSESFVDVGVKLSYDFDLHNRSTFRIYTGMKNIFNAYQKDFDFGVDRDPSYIYGPGSPRMLYFGVKIGNSLL